MLSFVPIFKPHLCLNIIIVHLHSFIVYLFVFVASEDIMKLKNYNL